MVGVFHGGVNLQRRTGCQRSCTDARGQLCCSRRHVTLEFFGCLVLELACLAQKKQPGYQQIQHHQVPVAQGQGLAEPEKEGDRQQKRGIKPTRRVG
ncbi:MAG: hypothetical protein C4297_12095 [Gemmataceae bacterium]